MTRHTRNNVIAMLWPVYGFRKLYPDADLTQQETVAIFFDYGDAVSFVNASERNLYIGEPRYDHLAREALTAAVERDLRFTMEMQAKRRAA